MCKSIGTVLKSANSINELLHAFHSYIINDENILQSAKLLGSHGDTKLYGMDTKVARGLLNSFEIEFNNSTKIILSLNENHLIVMLRDYGHATTLDINIAGSIAYIDYYIPKVCNYLLVNELPGVTKVNKDSKWAKGKIELSVDNLGSNLYTFVTKIPTDDDMFLKGGLCEEYGSRL